jgi:hypothetical protein
MLKPCVFFKEVKRADGKWQCRCKRDGSIRNRCSNRCPHFTPTFWFRVLPRRWFK